MSDIMEFITARLDEDERAARAATPGPWKDGAGTVALHRTGMDEITGYVHEQADIDHIIRHDPVAVLRDVAATRRIIELHHHETPYPNAPDFFGCTICGRDYAGDPTGGWCDTIRLVASRWSTHTDYRQEWAP